jgi:hypothetical protein
LLSKVTPNARGLIPSILDTCQEGCFKRWQGLFATCYRRGVQQTVGGDDEAWEGFLERSGCLNTGISDRFSEVQGCLQIAADNYTICRENEFLRYFRNRTSPIKPTACNDAWKRDFAACIGPCGMCAKDIGGNCPPNGCECDTEFKDKIFKYMNDCFNTARNQYQECVLNCVQDVNVGAEIQ